MNSGTTLPSSQPKSGGCFEPVFYGFLPFLLGYPLGESLRFGAWMPYFLLGLCACLWSHLQRRWGQPLLTTPLCLALIACGLGVGVLMLADLEEAQESPPSLSLAEWEEGRQERLPQRFSLAEPVMPLYPLLMEIRISKDGRGYAYPVVSRRHRLYQKCLQGKTLDAQDCRLGGVLWVLGSKGDLKRSPQVLAGPMLLKRDVAAAYYLEPDPLRSLVSRFVLALLLVVAGLLGVVIPFVRRFFRGGQSQAALT